jgi:hypothetical protein
MPPRFKDLDDLNNHLDHEGIDDDLDILGDEDLETLKIPFIPVEPPTQKPKTKRRKPKKSA